MTDTQNDLHVQLTNDSSIVSKASTCEYKYFTDPYVKHYAVIPEGMENLQKYRVGPDAGKKTENCSKKLNKKLNVSGSGKKKITRRAPLIHRGYAIRYVAVDLIVRKFVERLTSEHKPKFQIVLLGAGFDTLHHRMRDLGQLDKCSVFVEVDFPQVVLRKEAIMDLHREVFDTAADSDTGYHLVGADLKDLDNLRQKLDQIKNFTFDTPTLVISEVVLAYLPTSLADSVLKWVAKSFSNATSVLYEQVCPKTSFGLQMIRHFNKRNSPLFPLHDYPTTSCQPDRGSQLGYKHTCAVSLFDLIYDNHSNLDFVPKWKNIEPFDEYEEWHLKLQHYMVWVGDTVDHGIQLVSNDVVDSDNITTQVIDQKHFSIEKCNASGVRYGASHCFNGSKHFISGGFGVGHLSLHSRLDTVATSPSGEVFSKLSDPLIFTASASISDNSFVVFGGRQGPMKPSNKLYLIDDQGNQLLINNKGEVPSPRWRHQMISIKEKQVLLVAGQTINGTATRDVWFGNFKNDECEWRESEMKLPTVRHSCSSVHIPDSDEVVIFGGLDEFEYLLSEVILISTSAEKLIQLEPLPFGIYASKAVYCRSLRRIVLIGGITAVTSSENRNEIIIYHWCLDSRSYLGRSAVPLPADTIFLGINHQAFVDNEKLIITGGGGNCFSFGTHINDITVVVDLNTAFF